MLNYFHSYALSFNFEANWLCKFPVATTFQIHEKKKQKTMQEQNKQAGRLWLSTKLYILLSQI